MSHDRNVNYCPRRGYTYREAGAARKWQKLLVVSFLVAAISFVSFSGFVGFGAKVPPAQALPPALLLPNTSLVSLVGVKGSLGLAELTASAHKGDSQTVVATPGLGAVELEFELPGDIVHTVKKGETLSSIFTNLGYSSSQAFGVAAALKKLSKEQKKVRSYLLTGQRMEFAQDESGNFSSLALELSTTDKVVIAAAADGFSAKLDSLPTVKKVYLRSGVIGSSLAQAAQDLGLGYEVVDDLVDLFGDRIVFHRDVRKGDRFSIKYEQIELADGRVVGSGRIISAVIENKSKQHYVLGSEVKHGKGKKFAYFNEKGEPLGNGFLRYPLKYTRVSSVFNKSRFHPVLKRRRPHNGVDFAAPTGTPVRATGPAVVQFAGRKGAAGIMIKLKHSKKYQTAYLHLSRLAKGMKKGASVTRGQVIGYVGTTGRSTGPHLHYSFYVNGKYVDPLKVKLPNMGFISGATIAKAKLSEMIAELKAGLLESPAQS